MSSNLCDALAALIHAGQDKSVEISFRWASARPVATTMPRSVLFEGTTSSYLTEMARTLREQSTIEGYELIGPIRKLASADLENGGEITVAMAEPVPGRKVKVVLAGSAYQLAAQAHADDQWISCEGDLVRNRGALELLAPRNFRVLSDR